VDCDVEIYSSAMICISSFVKIGISFQIVLRVYLRNLKEIINYGNEMGSGASICIISFIKNGSAIQN
jgi:hypothetical protein